VSTALDDVNAEVKKLKKRADDYLAGGNEKAFVEQRAPQIFHEMIAAGRNGLTTTLRTLAREQATAEFHASRRQEAVALRAQHTAVRDQLAAARSEALTVKVPEVDLSNAEYLLLSDDARVMVREQRHTQRGLKELQIAFLHQSLTPDQLVAALEDAQTRGDKLAMADLDHRLTLALPDGSAYDEALTGKPRRKWAALREARLSGTQRQAFDDAAKALELATLDASQEAAREQLAANPQGPASVEAIADLWRATERKRELAPPAVVEQEPA
jgi:hypothetical protein